MKIIHSADWHLGAYLGQEKRYHEFSQILDFMLQTARENDVRCIIASGDIFHTPSPPNRAVSMYYDFLLRAADAGVRDVIITAGNHDSPSFLEAPKDLLKRLNVHISAHLEKEDLQQHFIELRHPETEELEAVVIAIPYLHERDIRQAATGETFDQHQEALRAGCIRIFQDLCIAAREKYGNIPLIATGHCWAVDRDTDNMVGGEIAIPVNDFAHLADYFALGHIHSSYPVGKYPHVRYSGALLAMKFDETKSEKNLLLLDTAAPADPQQIPIPCYQEMMSLSGTMEELTQAISDLKEQQRSIWLNVENTGTFDPDLNKTLEQLCADSELKIIICRNKERNPALLKRRAETERLEAISPEDVFMRILTAKDRLADADTLLAAFHEALQDVNEAEEKARKE